MVDIWVQYRKGTGPNIMYLTIWICYILFKYGTQYVRIIYGHPSTYPKRLASRYYNYIELLELSNVDG